MKHTTHKLLTLLFLFFVILCTGINADAAKKKYISLSAKRVEAHQVTLSWTKINANSYVIYREDITADDKPIKIATITNGKTTYIDSTIKKGKNYTYTIKGLNANGKKIKGQDDECYVTTSRLEPLWGDSNYASTNTQSCITLYVYNNNGIQPDGYEIYRSKSWNNGWKKIKTIKKRCDEFAYHDKNIKFGQCYFYQVKAYWFVNGKKKYKCTPVAQRYAVNDMKHAKFSLSILTPDGTQTDCIDMKIKNIKYNGTILINKDSVMEEDNPCTNIETYLHYTTKTDQTTEDSIGLKFSEYSLDGKIWKKPEENKNIELLPGKSLFLRFAVYDLDTNQSTTMQYHTKDIQSFACRLLAVRYCNIPYQWNIDLKKQTIKLDTSNYTYGKVEDTPFWIHTSSEKRKTAIRAYKHFLASDTIDWADADVSQFASSDCQFALAYIDKDSIPELILKSNKATNKQGVYSLYTYTEGSLVNVSTLRDEVYYYEKTGIMNNISISKKGREQYYEKMEGRYLNPFLHSVNGKYSDIADDKISISKKQFNKRLKKQIGSAKVKKISTYDNNTDNRKKYLK